MGVIVRTAGATKKNKERKIFKYLENLGRNKKKALNSNAPSLVYEGRHY